VRLRHKSNQRQEFREIDGRFRRDVACAYVIFCHGFNLMIGILKSSAGFSFTRNEPGTFCRALQKAHLSAAC
jgi:hypothetical protein